MLRPIPAAEPGIGLFPHDKVFKAAQMRASRVFKVGGMTPVHAKVEVGIFC